MGSIFVSLMVLGVFLSLFYHYASRAVWGITLLTLLLIQAKVYGVVYLTLLCWFVSALCFIPLSLSGFRQKFISSSIFKIFKASMPQMSKTEKEALKAGSITWEGELFSGKPDFKKLLALKPNVLSEDEQAFIDNEVDKLCAMLDEWQITHQDYDLSSEVWSYLKKQGFFGLIIPKQYGGRAFSALAVSEVLVKIYSQSVTCATTVSVPNSLGPAELLLKYGTEEQKNYYLPRLASGQELPCFGLTSAHAGSDAASIPDTGIICRDLFKGEEVLGIRLNWNKRYITLAPVATLIGLAFRLFDPDALLGDVIDIGITCALIPAQTKGVITGRRHLPLNTPFMNGPTQGNDVFIPLSYVIGGVEMVGQGWRMLMECLGAGRAVSLPSSALGACKTAALATGAYARIRRQFNTAIANFEGIEEPLARIGGETYMMNAAIKFTLMAIDQGEEPAVASAILKYHTTESARRVMIDAMDVHGGKGICLGAKNYLASGYQNAPISITVEGANILTRCLIIFGQGAIRCHPYILEELKSAEQNNLQQFDKAFWAHISHFCSNGIRSLLLGLTDGHLIVYHRDKLKRPIQLMSRYSANLAFLADFSMFILGSQLKFREKISARLGDLLSLLYLCSAVIKQFHDEARSAEDWPLVKWSYFALLSRVEQTIVEIIDNFPKKWARSLLKIILLPLGQRRKKPHDHLGSQVAQLLTTINGARTRLTKGLYLQQTKQGNSLADLEDALIKVLNSMPLEKKLTDAIKHQKIASLTLLGQIDEAVDLGLLTEKEADILRSAELARQKVIAVDDFAKDALSVGEA